MQHYQISWEEALHLVQNRRYCISPNGGFLTQIKARIHPDPRGQPNTSLQEYEAIYKANVAVASYMPADRVVSRRKREDDDDEDRSVRTFTLLPATENCTQG